MKFIKEIIPYVIIIIVVVLLRTYIITPVRVTGSSMNKTLNDGDILLLYKIGHVDRFDVVVLNEKDDNDVIIKRIIGMPGETVMIRNETIYINDEALEDPYAYGKTSDYDKITLKDDEYFILGDNRLISKDSRYFGPINKNDIKGITVLRIYPFNKISSI